MIWDPSTLAQLSAPGFNRAIGAGDVVPYWGPQPGETVGGAGAATPGVSFDPNLGADLGSGPTGSIGAGGDSALNNLSALTPILNQIVQQQQQDAIVSGQGNAQANPLPGAVPGVSSASLAPQIDAQAQAGGVPIAGAGGVAGIAPQAGGSTPSGSPSADSGGGAAAGPAGAPGDATGDTGAGGPGAPGSAPGDSGVGPGTGTAPGDASDAGAPGAPGAPGDTGSGDSGAGGGGAGGGAGSSVICSELRRQGYLDENVWIADEAFGRSQSRATRAGYRLWAASIARGMARSRVLTLAVAALAIPWAVEMAYQMGVRKHGNLLGRAVMAIGLPLCTYLGRIGVKTGSVHV